MSLLYNNKESLGDIIMYLHILMKIGIITIDFATIISFSCRGPYGLYYTFTSLRLSCHIQHENKGFYF